MAVQQYNTSTPRIGKIAGEILKHAEPKLVLGISGDQKKIGKNQSDTIVYRRWVPVGGTAGTAAGTNTWDVTAAGYQVSEGVTPAAQTLAPDDITVQLQQYAVLFSYTDKTADLYEDKIPDEMKLQAGETMGLVREMVDYGALKGCTNKFYSGGTSRATVDEAISLTMLRKVSKSILGNRGSMVTKVLGAGPNYATAPVEQSFLVFCHTDLEHDIRELPGFKATHEYAHGEPIHECELGSADRYRFILSPELGEIADSGAAIGSTGLVSTTGTNIDVYPIVVIGKDAWANVALRGMSAIKPIHVPYDQADSFDPLGQVGYIGCKFYSASFVQNDGWMAVVEAGATDV
jgi:N4-gp56 family major capsid protein